MTIEISASTVAWYAAIVATLSAIVSAYNILRDRAKLKIAVRPNMKFYPEEPPYGDKTYVVVTVTNVGRRPITVTHVWFETPNKADEKMLLADSVKHGSREIGEGKWADYPCVQDQLPASLQYVCVSDSTGRTHRKRLSKEVRKAIGASNSEAQNSEEG
jgi:hypothetical protein